LTTKLERRWVSAIAVVIASADGGTRIRWTWSGIRHNPPRTARVARQLDIKPVVVVTEEHRLAPIATLGNVVRHIRHDRAAPLCHGGIPAQAGKG
jgi:hypothetical protein